VNYGIPIIATILYLALSLFILVMWARLVLDLIVNFSRGWRPRGPLLVVAEVVFTITDPPIKTVRRVVPPLRLGAIQLDFSWSIVLLAAIILSYVALGFMN
jgi:YggT family protein